MGIIDGLRSYGEAARQFVIRNPKFQRKKLADLGIDQMYWRRS
jgi:hypothetical protein